MGAVAAIVSLLRQFIADPDMFKSIWAEDGWMPLCVVARGHGSCLFEPVNGYWPVLHRILAEGFALLPLVTWPFMFPLFAALMMGGMCAVVFLALRSNGQERMGLILGLGIPMIPSLGIEFINVVGNVHWILLIVAMLMMLMTTSNLTLLLVLVVVASLTNPVSFVLMFMVGLLWFVDGMDSRQGLILFSASLISWAIQLVFVLRFDGTNRVEFASETTRVIEVWSNSLLGIVPGLRVSDQFGGGLNSGRTWLTSLAVVLATVGVLAWVILSRRFSLLYKKIAVFGIVSQVLTVFVLIGFRENPRYAFVLLTLNAIWIMSLIEIKFGRSSLMVGVVGLLLLPLPALKAGSYRTTHSQIEWSEQIKILRTECESGRLQTTAHFAPGVTYKTLVPCKSVDQ